VAIIADYMSGDCRIVIHDDYVVKTREEYEEIKRRMSEIYYFHRRKEIEERRKLERLEKQVS